MAADLKDLELDRTFEAIYRDLRLRIPRYSKEWTNFNDSDPGVTLLKLFAWLSESMYFQMNQVTRKNYVKFLKLLGVTPRAALPARVSLGFTTKGTESAQPIPKGSQFGAQTGDGQLLIFETEADLDVIAAPLSMLQVLDGGSFTPVTEANASPEMTFKPFGWEPALGNALYLGFDEVAPGIRPFPQRMSFRALLPAAVTAGRPQRVDDTSRVGVPGADLVWEYRPLASSTAWEPLNVLKDETAAFTADGYIEVEGPAKIEAIQDPRFGEEKRYWIRVRLDRRNYSAGRAPELESLKPNTVDAVNLRTERNRVLGFSDGQADRKFTFPKKPIDRDSLVIKVGEEIWERKDDFLDAGPGDQCYRLDAASGTIEFGDGEHGEIPGAGLEIIAEVSRSGGGAIGNTVGPGGVTLMITQPVGIDRVSNDRASVGGADEQDLKDLILEGPRFLRRKGRALTAEDFESLVREEVQDVKQAKAIAGMHPSFPGVQVPGAVTVLIVPKHDARPPLPSAELIDAVARRLEPRRLLTTEVHVAAPTFREVRVEAVITSKPTASADRVARDARERLEKQLDARTWTFGKDLAPSEIFRWLLDDKSNDVTSVERANIYVDGRLQEGLQAVKLNPGELLYSGHHLIVVRPFWDT